MDGPIVSILVFGMAGWFLKQWFSDRKDAMAGNPHPKGLPGATECSNKAIAFGVAGGIGIALLVTAAEFAAGVAGDQSEIAASALLGMLGAAVIEEVIVRSWIVVTKKGKRMLIGSCIVVSLAFALGHPFLWDTEDGLRFKAELQPMISACGIFSISLWLYAARFLPLNPKHSLLPCFAGHAAFNIVVFIVKLALGLVLIG